MSYSRASDNPSRGLTEASSLSIGVPSAITSGLGSGTTLASQGASAAIGISQAQISQHDSFLKVLEAFAKINVPNKIAGLDLFGPDIEESLLKVAQPSASSAYSVSVAPSVLGTHASQLPVNSFFASRVASRSTNNPSNFVKSEATTFDENEDKNNFSANCKHLSKAFKKIFGDLFKDVDGLALGNAHGSIVKSSGAASGIATIASSGSLSGTFDLIGSAFRESSALAVFFTNESDSNKDAEERNIYIALRECSAVFSRTADFKESLGSLEKLRKAIVDFNEAKKLSVNHGASTPSVSVFTRSMTSAPFVTALESVLSLGTAVSLNMEASSAHADDLLESAVMGVTQASSIKSDLSDQAAVTHSQNIIDTGNAFDKLNQFIDKELAGLASEQKTAVSASAKSTVGLTFALSLVPAAVTALLGCISREKIGVTVSLTQESNDTDNECKAVSKSELANSADNLEILVSKASELDARLKRCAELGIIAPVTMAVSEMGTCAALYPAVSALQTTLNSLEATRVMSQVFTAEKENLTQSSQDSFSEASSLQNREGKVVGTHSNNVSQLTSQFVTVTDAVEEKLKEQMGENKHRKHRTMASSSATVMLGISSAVTSLPELLTTGAPGVLLRELLAMTHSIKHDKGTADESKKTVNNVTHSKSDRTGKDLDELITAVSKLQERIERCEKFGVSAPVLLGISHIVTAGSLITSLNSLAGMCFALSECRHLTNPSKTAALQLDEKEQMDEVINRLSFVMSHAHSAKFSRTEEVSGGVTLLDHLQSIMEKAILTDRASENPSRAPRDPRINRTGRSLIMDTTGFMTGVLGMLSLVVMESGITVESFWRAFRLATEKCSVMSKGPDESKTGRSHFNLSFSSNTTRATAAVSDHWVSSATQASSHTTHHASEVTLSRSLTIALCQSGVLTEALKNLSQRLHVDNELFSKTSNDSGRLLVGELAAEIKKVLDKANDERGEVPGLNRDMASQLATVSETSIATALSTHSLLIAPFLQSFVVARKATATRKNQTNEGVFEKSSTSEFVSQISNLIQAFTQNCIDALKENAAALPPQELALFNTSMRTHIDSNRTTASSMLATCYTSLFCDELIESVLSRSLSLLDAEKMRNSRDQSTAMLDQEAKEAAQQTAADSQLSESASVTRVVSALRLTLSHLGESLARMASLLHTESDLLEDDMEMHTSQRVSLKIVSEVLSNCSYYMATTAGILSMLPLSSLDTIEDLRQVIRSIESIKSHNSGAIASTFAEQDSSITLLPLGVTSDIAGSTLLLFIKTVLSALVRGSDSVLTVAKILEIMSLHQRPEEAFTLMTQASLQPQTGSASVTKPSASCIIAPTVGSSAVSLETVEMTNSSDCTESTRFATQKMSDKVIDSWGFLEDSEDSEEDSEAKESKVGLKKFFEIVILILTRQQQVQPCLPADLPHHCADIANMLNRGSIATALHHSAHLKSPLRDVRGNPLLNGNTFLGCNNAADVIEALIATLTNEGSQEVAEKLMNNIKKELAEEKMPYSSKVHTLWNYIKKEVKNNLQTKNSKGIFNQEERANVLSKGSMLAKKKNNFNPTTFDENCALKDPVSPGPALSVRLSIND